MNTTPFSLEIIDATNAEKIAFLRSQCDSKVQKCLSDFPAITDASFFVVHLASPRTDPDIEPSLTGRFRNCSTINALWISRPIRSADFSVPRCRKSAQQKASARPISASQKVAETAAKVDDSPHFGCLCELSAEFSNALFQKCPAAPDANSQNHRQTPTDRKFAPK